MDAVPIDLPPTAQKAGGFRGEGETMNLDKETQCPHSSALLSSHLPLSFVQMEIRAFNTEDTIPLCHFLIVTWCAKDNKATLPQC